MGAVICQLPPTLHRMAGFFRTLSMIYSDTRFCNAEVAGHFKFSRTKRENLRWLHGLIAWRRAIFS
ncbi:hypothetical protein COCSUDRAFT_32006 [Coccomyxa subellipsoidea C-169]|uniref:Uncharacterized protein n=1 Tax=Coccomyxa subellipsoidea (strain C-169) TaxID=574566 RepID=I0Z9W7_COCSC|nr:hypothetical protein COCSUDRAFT_32006 [Coccomyxa subellipsoidea C-169]EIE27436.1 hypothetical protein COCSUDRAFT_32006 [Coccomyxa subellipsoidea C-169]|eukprot:XP_005651980.1 hypothetical protein COCSUDRAFT_32006 [Coccomyxa subellipsoidea C-169]